MKIYGNILANITTAKLLINQYIQDKQWEVIIKKL